jgi:hypothetical protein
MASSKRRVMGAFLLVVLLTILASTVARAQCPDSRIYVGGPATNAAAVRGREANPAADMNEAWQICEANCPDGAYIWQYGAEGYAYVGSCAPGASEPSGPSWIVPFVAGGAAVGGAAAGYYFYTRWRRERERE